MFSFFFISFNFLRLFFLNAPIIFIKFSENVIEKNLEFSRLTGKRISHYYRTVCACLSFATETPCLPKCLLTANNLLLVWAAYFPVFPLNKLQEQLNQLVAKCFKESFPSFFEQFENLSNFLFYLIHFLNYFLA